MDILTSPVRTETSIKNSRFISELLPCDSQALARDLLKSQKRKYADASHVVHAFIIGSEGSILGMSDAGEPSGTAGRPMLDVLKGRKCTNTLLTVTRYFGGTLLGTGGLVKAYSGCASSVIEQADGQGAFEPFVMRIPFRCSFPYPLYESARRYMATMHIDDLSEKFDTEVSVSGRIRADELEGFAARIFDMSGGKTSVRADLS